jgi:hypothetical protein
VLAVKVLRGDFKQAKGYALEYVDRNAPENAEAK